MTDLTAGDIYLDNAATTPVLPQVAQGVLTAMTEDYGNPSSLHRKGIDAEQRVKDARSAVADALGTWPAEIVFTSGGTEANNLAIWGAVRAYQGRGRHVVTTRIEHSSVLQTCRQLENEGFSVTYLPVDETGHVSAQELASAVQQDTILISIALVNNEIGVVNRLDELSQVARSINPRVIVHTDAVQAFCKIPTDPKALGVDLLSLSGHKINAPKGIGALYVREGVRLAPLMIGGGQESGLRPGTENVPGIVGLGIAAREHVAALTETRTRLEEIKHKTAQALLQIEGSRINGTLGPDSAPHILNVSFAGVGGEVLVRALAARGVYVSSGSACSSRKTGASHVLKAINPPDWVLSGSIRISFSASTQWTEVEPAVEVIKETVSHLRRQSNWKGIR